MAATHRQADRYLHQCFIVGLNEPYIEVCTRLAELSPCRVRGSEPAAGLPAAAPRPLRPVRILYVDDVVQSGLGWIGRVWAIEH